MIFRSLMWIGAAAESGTSVLLGSERAGSSNLSAAVAELFSLIAVHSEVWLMFEIRGSWRNSEFYDLILAQS